MISALFALALAEPQVAGETVESLLARGWARFEARDDLPGLLSQAAGLCAIDVAGACTLAGYIAMTVSPPDPQAALGFFARGCAAGAGQSCTGHGHLYASDALGTPDGARALPWFIQGCDAGDAEGCQRQAAALLAGSPPPTADVLLPVLLRGCRAGDTGACVNHTEFALRFGRPTAAAGWTQARAAQADALAAAKLTLPAAVFRLRWCATDACATAVSDALSGDVADGWEWMSYLADLRDIPDGGLHRAVVQAIVDGEAEAARRALTRLQAKRSDRAPLPVERPEPVTPPALRYPRSAYGTGDVWCPTTVAIDRTGAPTAVRPEGCPEAFAEVLRASLPSGRWSPVLDGGSPVEAVFHLVVVFDDPTRS